MAFLSKIKSRGRMEVGTGYDIELQNIENRSFKRPGGDERRRRRRKELIIINYFGREGEGLKAIEGLSEYLGEGAERREDLE